MHPLRLARYHIRQCKLLSYTAKHQIPNLFSYIAYDFSASSYKSRNGTTVKYLPLSYFNVSLSLSLTFTIFLCSINFRWPQSTPNQVREFQILKPKKKKQCLGLNNWIEFWILNLNWFGSDGVLELCPVATEATRLVSQENRRSCLCQTLWYEYYYSISHYYYYF